MSAAGAIAAIAVGLTWSTASGWRRWWAGGRVAARPGLPRRRRAPLPRLTRWLADAGVSAEPTSVLRAWAGAIVLASLLAAISPSGVVFAAVVLAGPPVALAASQGRARRRRAAQLPLALDAVSASMRAGHAVAPAIAEAAAVGSPLGPELAALVGQVARGLPIAVALDEWAERSTDRGTVQAAAALAVAATVGGPGADAVEAAAASIRARASSDAEAVALSVQARASAAVLSAAPVAFTAFLATVDPASARFLLASPAGWTCLTVGLTLDASGAIWMRRLVRGAP